MIVIHFYINNFECNFLWNFTTCLTSHLLASIDWLVVHVL